MNEPKAPAKPPDGPRSAASDAGDAPAPLFDEFYDDWAAFDAAVARAVALHHPIRKRSSLTFDVYNRTVSKGKHDRRSIAEFLSKTFKCTHGIKFRSRGSGKRSRHKLRDIGCPFHVYACAVEFGPTYRVKVRTHDKHNHPIGPDALKVFEAARDSELSLSQEREALEGAASAASGSASSSSVVNIVPQLPVEVPVQLQAQAAALSQAFAQAHAHVLLKAQGHSQTFYQANAPTLLNSNSLGRTSPSNSLLDGNVHDSDSLLARAIASTMDEEALMASTSAPASSTAATAVNASPSATSFEPTMTLESLRKRVTDFSEAREWNEIHSPRNLLLALSGEVGELCNMFKWRGESRGVDSLTAEEKEHLGEGLSDAMIYLIRLADKCNVDLPAALNSKIARDCVAYPAEAVRESSKKNNENKRRRTS